MSEARNGQVIAGKKGKEMRRPPWQSGPNQRAKWDTSSEECLGCIGRNLLSEMDTGSSEGSWEMGNCMLGIVSPVAEKLVDLPFLLCPCSLESLLLTSLIGGPCHGP